MSRTNAHPSGIRISRRALKHIALGVLVWLATGPAISSPVDPVQLARHAAKKMDEEGMDIEGAWGPSSAPRLRHGYKRAPGGYDAKRIKRFWHNYRPPKPVKEKEPKHRQAVD